LSSLVIKQKLIGNYYLVANDDIEDLTLSFHESTDENNYSSIIEATVFAVGYNDSYLIAKQHPRIFPNPSNKGITNYYILPLKADNRNWKNKNGLIGPLSLTMFKGDSTFYQQ
jgi:hypothetical protein